VAAEECAASLAHAPRAPIPSIGARRGFSRSDPRTTFALVVAAVGTRQHHGDGVRPMGLGDATGVVALGTYAPPG